MTRAELFARQQRLADERRRNSLLALAAVLAHAVLLLLLPGFARPVDRPLPLLVTLSPAEVPVEEPVPVQATADGTQQQATAPVQSPVVTENDPRDKPVPARPAVGRPSPTPRPAAASPSTAKNNRQSPSQAQGATPQKPKGEAASPKAQDATDVQAPNPAAVEAVDKPEIVKQEASKPAPSKVDGTANKPSQQQSPSNSTPGKARPSAGSGSGDSAAGSGVDSKPSPNKGTPNPGPAQKQAQPGGQGGSTSARPDKTDGGSGPATAPAEGPAAAPPGPSKGQLDLMSAWEAAQRKKIRMLARTPEYALEQKHKGKVTFAVTCDSRGKLLGVSIVRTGGHGELDQECKEATRTARFDKFPAGVPFSKWTFDMTLQFPIEGGY